MTNKHPDFDEIPEARSLGGIFAGDGLQNFDSVPTKVEREGLTVTTACEGRGKPVKVIVDWPTVIYISMGREAPDWRYDPSTGLMRWMRGCSCCSPPRMYPFGLTPQECKAAIERAISYTYLSAQQVNNAMRQIQAQPAGR